jgi:hypothetical protein
VIRKQTITKVKDSAEKQIFSGRLKFKLVITDYSGT